MLKLAFSVYDSKSEVYGVPFFARTKGEALRSFMSISNDRQSQIGMYPADFTLFYVGTFDEANARLVPEKTPVSMAVAIELVKNQEELKK